MYGFDFLHSFRRGFEWILVTYSFHNVDKQAGDNQHKEWLVKCLHYCFGPRLSRSKCNIERYPMTIRWIEAEQSARDFAMHWKKRSVIDRHRAAWFVEDAPSYDVDRINVVSVHSRSELVFEGLVLIVRVLLVKMRKNPAKVLVALCLRTWLMPLQLPEGACWCDSTATSHPLDNFNSNMPSLSCPHEQAQLVLLLFFLHVSPSLSVCQSPSLSLVAAASLFLYDSRSLSLSRRSFLGRNLKKNIVLWVTHGIVLERTEKILFSRSRVLRVVLVAKTAAVVVVQLMVAVVAFVVVVAVSVPLLAEHACTCQRHTRLGVSYLYPPSFFLRAQQ